MVITKGFHNVTLERDIKRMVETQPISITKFIRNIADIVIEDGHIIIIKKGARKHED